MTSLAEEFPKEQERVRKIRDEYVAMRGQPHINVEFAIAMIDASLRFAEQAASEADVVKMLMAFEDLKGYKL